MWNTIIWASTVTLGQQYLGNEECFPILNHGYAWHMGQVEGRKTRRQMWATCTTLGYFVAAWHLCVAGLFPTIPNSETVSSK